MTSTRWASVLMVLAVVSQASSRAPSALVAESAPLPPPAVCFAPGTSADVMRDVYQRVYGRDPNIPLFQFQPGNRWSATATNPGPLSQGDPTTLRWSIVPDGTMIGGFAGEPASPSTLIASLNTLYGSPAVWQPLFQQVFDRWGELTGNTYIYEPNDDGAAFPLNLGTVGVRGDVRIAAHPIDGNGGVLAYNFFPNNGDMVIDFPDSFYNNTANNSLALRNVLAHEHGHGLGIDHVCPANQTKLMEPFATTVFDGPQHDDVLAGQRGYGDDNESNDFVGAATNLGTLGNGTVTRIGVSVDDNLDVDSYRFTVAAGKRVSVTVTPVGFTYLDAPQNIDGSCPTGTLFDSLVLNDIGFQLVGTDTTTILATADSQPPGAAESVANVVLGLAGTYYVRVLPGGNDQVQLYDLALTVSDTEADVFVTKTDGQATATAGGTVTYTIQVSNAGPSPVGGVTVADTFPAAITAVSWTCSAFPGSGCAQASGTGNINHTVNLAVGGTATFTAVATLSPSATGTLVNTVTASSPIADPVPGNNSATDTDTIATAADLSVTKTDGQAAIAAGDGVSYTIVASNAGPSSVSSATVTDTLPAALTGASWTCAAAGGASCTASGSGNIADTVSLPVNGTVTYTLNATLTGSVSTLANTASVGVPLGVSDPNPTNNSATDENLVLCLGERVVVPDGRLTQAAIAPGAATWFLSRLKAGSSYSLELGNTTGGGSAPGTLSVFSGAQQCGAPSPVTVRDTSTIEPVGGAGSRRVSFTADAAAPFFRARLVNTSGQPIAYSYSWSETSLYSAAWSTNGSFDTFYSFQNTTGSSLSGTLTFFDTGGLVVSSFPVTLPADRTTSINTQGLGVARNRTGTARFSHDGPPGAVLAEAAVANFGLNPAYVQPVKFQGVREAR